MNLQKLKKSELLEIIQDQKDEILKIDKENQTLRNKINDLQSTLVERNRKIGQLRQHRPSLMEFLKRRIEV